MQRNDVIRKRTGNAVIIFVSFLMLLMLSGCYTKGPLFNRAAPEYVSPSIIYIYRPDAACLRSKEIQFLVDADYIVTLRGNEYSYVHVDPGEHVITSGEIKKDEIPSLKIKITSEKGKSRYVQYKMTCKDDYIIFNSSVNLYLGGIPEGLALSEIKNTTLTTIPNVKVGKRDEDPPE